MRDKQYTYICARTDAVEDTIAQQVHANNSAEIVVVIGDDDIQKSAKKSSFNHIASVSDIYFFILSIYWMFVIRTRGCQRGGMVSLRVYVGTV
jgi:hypothetical protein